MKSISVRIFIWFWVTLTVCMVSITALSLMEESGPALSLWRYQVGRTLTLAGETALWIASEKGRDALRSYLAHLGAPTASRLYLFNDQLREVSGRAGGPRLRRFARRLLEHARVMFDSGAGTFLVGQRVTGPDGRYYVIIKQMAHRPLRTILGSRRVIHDLLARITLIMAVVGLFSLLLARYLTRPLMTLKNAVRRLARGDLEVQVAPAIVKRRDEIGELARDFNHMAKRIEQLMKAQKRLLRDVSHELRSPLARLHVALELARNRDDGELEPMLNRIEREARRLNELIGQLLDLVRLQSGVLKAEGRRCPFTELVRSVVADAAYEARAAGKEVRLEGEAPVELPGSEELLRRAVENVVRNALRYTAEGSAVDVGVRVETAGRGNEVVLTVRDRGPGVPSEALSDMFKPFHRVGGARERDSGGVGLGLAIAREAIRVHGGTIEARNRTSGGLEVTVRLPLPAVQGQHGVVQEDGATAEQQRQG